MFQRRSNDWEICERKSEILPTSRLPLHFIWVWSVKLAACGMLSFYSCLGCLCAPSLGRRSDVSGCWIKQWVGILGIAPLNRYTDTNESKSDRQSF